MARIKSYRETGERYPVLRALATVGHWVGGLLLTLSALVLVVGIGSYLVDIVRPVNGVYILFASVVWSLGLLVAGIQSIALASFFRLAIHVEENTRASAQALERMRSSSEEKPEVDARSIFLS